jgi:mRNA-decapping enzyme subunit 2
VLNCPAEELNSFERILFLVEQAHWYYEDFVREQNTALRGRGLHSSTFQLKLSRSSPKTHLEHPPILRNNFETPSGQPLNAPPIP